MACGPDLAKLRILFDPKHEEPRRRGACRHCECLAGRCVIAAVPSGRAYFLFRYRCNIELRLQPVEDRSKAENLPRNRRRAGTGAGVAFAGHLQKQIDALAEIRLVAEVEFSSAIA